MHTQFLYFGWLGHGYKLLFKIVCLPSTQSNALQGIQYVCTFMGPTLTQKLRLFIKIYSRIFRGYVNATSGLQPTPT